MKKVLVLNEEVQEHIEGYCNVTEAFNYYKQMLESDLKSYLSLITQNEDEVRSVCDAIDTYEDMISLIEYITNGEDKIVKDIVRQAYVISNVSIPFKRITPKFKPRITIKERKELDNLNIPYTIDEIYTAAKENEDEIVTQMTIADYLCLKKIIKKNKDKNIKKLFKKFEDEFASSVPNEDVKEIHLYFSDYDEDIIFLDDEGLHKVVGKKARVIFKNGSKTIGYLGSDFKDEDGDDCLSLFESYNEYKGFYNYNMYKLKDILKIDVLVYPRDEINFNFEIKVRDINNYVRGVTEIKK